MLPARVRHAAGEAYATPARQKRRSARRQPSNVWAAALFSAHQHIRLRDRQTVGLFRHRRRLLFRFCFGRFSPRCPQSCLLALKIRPAPLALCSSPMLLSHRGFLYVGTAMDATSIPSQKLVPNHDSGTNRIAIRSHLRVETNAQCRLPHLWLLPSRQRA
jgi:hypothetical protein